MRLVFVSENVEVFPLPSRPVTVKIIPLPMTVWEEAVVSCRPVCILKEVVFQPELLTTAFIVKGYAEL